MYLVAVTFDIHPAETRAFAARVARQAADSLEEPGCARFDVWQAPGNPGRVFLFEIYDDRAAFDTHLASPHFIAFAEETAAWVADKTVETWTLG